MKFGAENVRHGSIIQLYKALPCWSKLGLIPIDEEQLIDLLIFPFRRGNCILMIELNSSYALEWSSKINNFLKFLEV